MQSAGGAAYPVSRRSSCRCKVCFRRDSTRTVRIDKSCFPCFSTTGSAKNRRYSAAILDSLPGKNPQAPLIYQVSADSLTIHKKFIPGKLSALTPISHKPRRIRHGAGVVWAIAALLCFEKEEAT